MPMPTPEEEAAAIHKFNIWFVEPYEILKANSNGHGAFLALSLGLFLCERYFRWDSTTTDEHWRKDFLVNAARHFNTDHTFFSSFWDVYRNGMQHQGTPKTTTDYGWDINGDYSFAPQKASVKGRDIICLNPWAFAEEMIALWWSNSQALADNMSHHRLGDTSSVALACLPFPPATPYHGP